MILLLEYIPLIISLAGVVIAFASLMFNWKNHSVDTNSDLIKVETKVDILLGDVSDVKQDIKNYLDRISKLEQQVRSLEKEVFKH